MTSYIRKQALCASKGESLAGAEREQSAAARAVEHTWHRAFIPGCWHCRYTDTGFLVNDVTVDGALLCLRDLWMRWDVPSVGGVTPDSIAMLFLLRPFPGEALELVSLLRRGDHVNLGRAVAHACALQTAQQAESASWLVGAELLILGTGAQIAPVSPAVQAALRDQGIGLEVADTVLMLSLACNTQMLVWLHLSKTTVITLSDGVCLCRPMQWQPSIS